MNIRQCLETCGPVQSSSAAIAVIGAAALIGAWIFQYGFGLVPCPLCLEQRYAYYLVIPLAAAVALAAPRGLPLNLALAALGAIALAALANAWLGGYHAGVEWGWWQGPTACSGAAQLGTGNLIDRLQSVRIVRCDEVQWRFLGLSLAGYNVLISLALAAIAICGIVCARRRAA